MSMQGLTVLHGEGLSADCLAWTLVAEAAAQARAVPGLSSATLDELERLDVAVRRCAAASDHSDRAAEDAYLAKLIQETER